MAHQFSRIQTDKALFPVKPQIIIEGDIKKHGFFMVERTISFQK